MYLIVGLGNPGAQYAHTRHNVGFDVLEVLARRLGASISRGKCGALIGECFANGQKTVLALPQTYMNLSGQAVSRLMSWYKVEPEHLLVIYDDIDLAQGAVRIRPNGSAGTHNGMRSIVEELGLESFPRIRVGVGERKPGYELADWVLSRYQLPEEKQAAQAAYEQAAEAALEFIQNGIESAMCKYNTKKQKKPKPAENGEEGAEQ
ncbi:MAG: aminoacyl-tRNA hydrolase [Clostridia bacterium]